MNVRKYLAALGAVLFATLLWTAPAAAQEAAPAAPEAGQKSACTHEAGQACTAACPHAAAEAAKCPQAAAEGCAKKCGDAGMEDCHAMMRMCAAMMRTHDSGEGCVGMCLVGEGPACPKHRAARHCGGDSHCAAAACDKAACPKAAACGAKACDKAACPKAAEAGACHKAPEPATR